MMNEEEFAEVNEKFDERVRLFKEKPELFEKMRLEAIESFLDTIKDLEKRKRLEGLQWRVDQVRRKNKNPLSSCTALSEMMWANFRELNELWKEARELIGKSGLMLEKTEGDLRSSLEEVKKPKEADIVPLTPRKKESEPEEKTPEKMNPIDPVLDPNRPRGPYAS